MQYAFKRIGIVGNVEERITGRIEHVIIASAMRKGKVNARVERTGCLTLGFTVT